MTDKLVSISKCLVLSSGQQKKGVTTLLRLCPETGSPPLPLPPHLGRKGPNVGRCRVKFSVSWSVGLPVVPVLRPPDVEKDPPDCFRGTNSPEDPVVL